MSVLAWWWMGLLAIDARYRAWAQDRVMVRCETDHLAVMAEGVTLKEILAAVSEQCQIRIIVLGGVAADPMTVRLTPTLIHAGLKRLFELTGIQNYALVSSHTQTHGHLLVERVVIFGDEAASSPASLSSTSATVATASHPTSVLTMSRPEVSQLLTRPQSLPYAIHTTATFNGGHQQPGLKIQTLPPDTLLAVAGVHEGDILLEVNGITIDSRATLQQAYQQWQHNQEGGFRFAILRNGEFTTRYIVFNEN